MKEIKLVLSVDETNQILDALGNLPFKSVFGLIGKIQQQAAGQLNGNGAVPTSPAIAQENPTPELVEK